MNGYRDRHFWPRKLIGVLNAPLTLWLLSAIGIGLFSSAYSNRNQCLADARRISEDYAMAGLEWGVRMQTLVPILSSDTPPAANTVIAAARGVSATRQFKDASAYDVVMTLARAREQIVFPESDEALTAPIDAGAVPYFSSRLLDAGAQSLKYDHHIPPNESLGIIAAIASASLAADTDFLETAKIALRNAMIVTANEALREQKYSIRPNCSYGTILRQLFTGEPQPVLRAVALH